MALVSDLLTSTLKLINVVAKTEVPSADEQTDAFNRLNDMMDSWQAERLMVYNVVRTVFNLTSGKQAYSIGTSGTPDFNITRPLWIQDAGIINTAVSPTFELPMRALTDDEWSEVTVKGVQAALSWYFYYDYAFPNGNISFWPIPNVGTLQAALYLPTAVTQFAAVSTPISLPPGWAEAIRYNLAVRLAPEFGKQIDPIIAAMATETKRTIERANTRLNQLGIDPSIVGAGGNAKAWNWILGTGGAYR